MSTESWMAVIGFGFLFGEVGLALLVGKMFRGPRQ